MFREYTRETPARRGFAVVFAALALALSTGLAWTLVRADTSDAALEKEIVPAFWPISFRVPADFNEVRSSSSLATARDTAADGAVRLVSGTPRGLKATLDVMYSIEQESRGLGNLLTQIGFDAFDSSEPIRVGSMQGRALYLRNPLTGEQDMRAAALRPDGVFIVIVFSASDALDSPRRLFRQICESVVDQDWHAPRS